MTLLAVFVSAVFAAPVEQDLHWLVTLDGKPIGERTASISWTPTDAGVPRRLVESWTELDATVLGFDYALREKFTAVMVSGAASVHATTDLSGQITEVQARRGGSSWTVTIGINGRESSREWPLTAIDLSTADLFDPDTMVPIRDRAEARVLAVETGDIIEGPVKSIGSSSIAIGTFQVPVEGYSWTTEAGTGKFWFSAAGYLVRYEHTVLGKQLVGTLSTAPPAGVDDAPIVPSATQGVEEIPL